MGILKDLTKEYFGEKVRKEDEISIEGLDVEIVSFTDNNGNFHKRGYKPKNAYILKELLKRMIGVRGDEGDFNDIDTSDIESMESLFNDNKTFNGNITGWNVPSVTDMNNMFYFASSFNQPIGNWDVSSVIDMSCMFWGASSFNQDISKWKFPNVTDMNHMFSYASSFNQDLSKWDLKGKENIEIFKGCPIVNKYKPKM